ncbi:hypothetical protein, partial [Staphylococcus aureus]|uniref:hypothetical protein n=1 Tax=Staphylococcus aureus TaxID=1280 RepID=UPI0011605E0B
MYKRKVEERGGEGLFGRDGIGAGELLKVFIDGDILSHGCGIVTIVRRFRRLVELLRVGRGIAF